MKSSSALVVHVLGELAGDNVFVDSDLALGGEARQKSKVFLAFCSQFAAARAFTFYVATSGRITAYRARGFATLRDIATEIKRSRPLPDAILLADSADFNFEALQRVCRWLLIQGTSVVLAGRTSRQILSLEGSGRIFKIYGRCQQQDPDGQPCQTPATRLYGSVEEPLKLYGLEALRQIARIATTLGLPHPDKIVGGLIRLISTPHRIPWAWLEGLTFGFLPRWRRVKIPLCSQHLGQRFNLKRHTLTLVIGPPKSQGRITALKLGNLGKSGTAGLLAQERGGGIVFTGLDKGARNINFRSVTFKVVGSLRDIVPDPQAKAVVVDEFHMLPENVGEALSWASQVLRTHDLYLFCPLTDLDLKPFESVAALALEADRVVNYNGQCHRCGQTANFMTAINRDSNQPIALAELRAKGWPRLSPSDRRAYDIVSVCLGDHPSLALLGVATSQGEIDESVETEALHLKAGQYRHEQRRKKTQQFSRAVGSIVSVALILPASHLPNLAFAMYLLTIAEITAFVFWYENKQIVRDWALGAFILPILWVGLLLTIGLTTTLLVFLLVMVWVLIEYVKRLALSSATNAREVDF